MYQLYIANKNYSSWSLRPWLLLTTLKIPFQEKSFHFTEHNWQAFRLFSPTGKVPCLIVEQITVWDSLAITEFVAESHPQVWPMSVRARAWARSAAAEMHSGFGTLREMCSMNCSIQVALTQITADLQKDIARIDELWNDGLRQFGGNFLAGNEFTAVDAFFAPVVLRIATYGLKLSDTAMAYCELIQQLPALQDWIKAGQLEPQHEAHEAECVRYGQLTHDARL
jgi:glutathione S-transferase